MREFIDREKATEDITTLLVDQTTPWIVLSGGSQIGKTEFAKFIANKHKESIFCKPLLKSYVCEFIHAIRFTYEYTLKDCISEFIKQNAEAFETLKLLGITYAASITEAQIDLALNLLFRKDVSSGVYSFARFLGQTASTDICCIFLDDFHRCDFDSYLWILEFWNALKSPRKTVIAICNFELNWESAKLLNLFRGIAAPVNIERFDSHTAYFEILKDTFHFENDFNLATVSKQLYSLYNGSSKLLFETIKMLENNMLTTSDEDRVSQILKQAQQILLGRFDELTNMHLLVLRLLSYCHTPISMISIIEILELNDIIATEIIGQLFNGNFINQSADKTTGKTLYGIRDGFLRETIIGGCTSIEKEFFETKIYRAVKKGQIDATLEQTLSLALELREDNSCELLLNYLNKNSEDISLEKKAYYIDWCLRSLGQVPDEAKSINNTQLLYTYGYYNSAESIINAIMAEGHPLSFDNLLLLGDIQHVLLSPKASQTYKQASEIHGISTSDRLKALNRQIMALNQEHQESLAEMLYRDAFDQYQDNLCVGLVELYRNSNNSFGYKEAMEYTLKGYALARELGEELEMYKCLHNICMLRLQYGHYTKPFNNNILSDRPTFENVLEFFSKHPEYRHERAYPLLDLGTVKMFEFVDTQDDKCLASAKRYYSEAQLYAKSFYAQHIAETGLLIVNSYQYAFHHKQFVRELRTSQYNRYLQKKDFIEDYRVHRKILLSLSLSAIITEDNQEATMYLGLAHPYITGCETLRFNKLCSQAGCVSYQKEPVSLDGKYEVYYGSEKFVPWLISLCH